MTLVVVVMLLLLLVLMLLLLLVVVAVESCVESSGSDSGGEGSSTAAAKGLVVVGVMEGMSSSVGEVRSCSLVGGRPPRPSQRAMRCRTRSRTSAGVAFLSFIIVKLTSDDDDKLQQEVKEIANKLSSPSIL